MEGEEGMGGEDWGSGNWKEEEVKGGGGVERRHDRRGEGGGRRKARRGRERMEGEVILPERLAAVASFSRFFLSFMVLLLRLSLIPLSLVIWKDRE